MLLLYLSFPETSHPGTLGIDKVTRRKWIHISWVNPLSSLWLLRSPNLFAVVRFSAYVVRLLQALNYAWMQMFASSLVLISDFGALILAA
jgi:hypothetical protein